MYSRVTQLEIDTMRIGVDDAVALFRSEVLPAMRDLEGYEGVGVFATPEGQGLIISFWETEQAAADAAGFAAGQLEKYVALFRSPPGREWYRVVHLESPPVPVT